MNKHSFKRKYFIFFILGSIVSFIFLMFYNSVIKNTSTNEFCASCHIHPHADATYKLSVHNSNGSGMSVSCVECHLPSKDNVFKYLSRKTYHGVHDLYVYATKDSNDIDWSSKRSVQESKRFVYEDGCIKCHNNLFPTSLDETGSESHLKYLRDPENSSCLQCHIEVGHYRGEQGLELEIKKVLPEEIYKEPTNVDSFIDFTEKIPGTNVAFNMKAIPGGKFKMGSRNDEPYRQINEGPVRDVVLGNFWMGEVEVTWNEYFAFFNATGSQGRKEAEETDENIDGITGATPPWGAPDQGWGMGTRPAITMTHYAAQVYCKWLSNVTGKNYRLPTEAEWEYAARGGTKEAYFFGGSPEDYERDGLWNKLFGPDTAIINSYVIYQENSPQKTQPVNSVKANPFGLRNMLGNVAEFCLDYYDEKVYAKYPKGVIKNPRGPRQGKEHVIRGGSYRNSAKGLRVAKREYTRTVQWLVTDPQIPKSIWWYSDCIHVGFRVVCEFDEDKVVLDKNNN